MVVDDSSIVRGIVTRTLEAAPRIKVVASVANGALAVKMLGTLECDVIVLDIEMPELDGISALPLLLAINPNVKIIMSSTLTRRGAEISMKAISLGAADYVAKPTSNIGAADAFRAELLGKVQAYGARARLARVARGPSKSGATGMAAPVASAPRVGGIAQSGPLTLRKSVIEKPSIIAIGASTGGPQALSEVLKNLGHGVTQPIVITQHMPPTFTAILAEHMNRYAGRPAAEAIDGEALQGGRIYVAPGGFHMLFEAVGAQTIVRLNDGPMENSCKPAVDPMFRALSDIYKKKLFTVILTGMGYDGLKGAQYAIGAGAALIAQDQASSIVWGMPGAVAQAGLCNAVLPLAQIGQAIGRVARGEML
ncbi:MAG: chemotaxis response regulator protein-glutamate methylesterase [Parvibaculum sp.]|nr:chemotaxis response regulator protein-glutamate methylesterase [Parvibaculum sp.]